MNCPRCGKLVDKHRATRETDACFAVVVMGWDIDSCSVHKTEAFGCPPGKQYGRGVPFYSTDIAAALSGLEKFSDWRMTKDPSIFAVLSGSYMRVEIFTAPGYAEANAPTLPLAIVRASMKAMLA